MNGNKVDVYRNLHKDCYSIKSRESDTYGEVVDHCDRVCIEDAEFVVRESGRDRVRSSGRKNVHAFVRGVVSDRMDVVGVDVTYDPFEYDSFVVKHSEEPIRRAERVLLDESGVNATGIVLASSSNRNS